MCEADISLSDQVVIFKGDFAINVTAFTTGDLIYMSGTKFLDAVASLEPYQESKSVTLFHFNKDNHLIALLNIIRHH